ncbi:MAG: hypothetical protein KGJ93_04865 [Patescibacteria group bacterium]|nr:hypothetical protein [Patescibacteria group bacterium]
MQAISSDITGSTNVVQITLAVKTSVPFSMNLVYQEELGLALTRKGTAIVGNQLAASQVCQGLFNHIDTASASSKMFAAFNGTIYDVVAGASSSGGWDATLPIRFGTFLNTTMALNGTSQPQAYTAGGWITSGGNLDLSNVPVGAKNPIEFKSRFYCTVSDVLYFTTVAVNNSVSWTAAGSGNLLISREDGGGVIQGLAKVPGYLLIFKQHSLKRWDGQSTFPEDLVSLGTQSAESIVYGQSTVYFFYGPKGFYATQGNFPVRISRPIQRVVDGIDPAFYSKINGWCDNEHVYWSVGNVTIDFSGGFKETHNNVVVRYTIDTQQWAVLKYGAQFQRMTKYVTGGTILIVAGDNNGNVLQLNTGNQDYGNIPISYILQSPEFDFGFRDKAKKIDDKIVVHTYNASGGTLQVLVNHGQGGRTWENVGKVEGFVSWVKPQKPLIGNVFEFRIIGTVTGYPVRIRGIDFLTSSVEILESTT